jgi:hypothetical protein
MSVRPFTQPDMTTQSAAAYKAAIENAIASMAEVAALFKPSEKSPVPDMTVQIMSGQNAIGGTIAAASVGPIGAPGANPRIDRIYFNPNGNAFSRAVGVEAAVPVAPAAPFGTLVICDVALHVGQTQITNNDITDLRSFLFSGPIFADGGYTNIVDPDGLFRIFIGKAGVDNRFIFKMHANSGGGSKIEIQDASGAVIATIHDTGVIQGKKLTVATLPAASAALEGARSYVTDSNTAVFNAAVASGGANKVPVFCDGAAWKVG